MTWYTKVPNYWKLSLHWSKLQFFSWSSYINSDILIYERKKVKNRSLTRTATNRHEHIGHNGLITHCRLLNSFSTLGRHQWSFYGNNYMYMRGWCRCHWCGQQCKASLTLFCNHTVDQQRTRFAVQNTCILFFAHYLEIRPISRLLDYKMTFAVIISLRYIFIKRNQL